MKSQKIFFGSCANIKVRGCHSSLDFKVSRYTDSYVHTVSGVFEDLKFKFQKDRAKIEVVLTLPSLLSQHTPETVLVSIS